MPVRRDIPLARFALALLCAAGVAACGKKKSPDDEPEALPKLSAIGPRRATAEPAADRPVTLVVQRIEFSARERLDAAAKLLDDAYIDASAQRLWRMNGLRVASLPISRSEEFAKSLPTAVGLGMRQLSPGAMPDYLAQSPPMPRPRVVSAVLQGDAPAPLKLPAGQPQWRIEMTPGAAAGRLRFRLTPQHHFVHPSILPRQPEEMLADGQMFDTLALTIDLPAGHALVVWWDRPDVLPFPTDPVWTTQPAESIFPTDPPPDPSVEDGPAAPKKPKGGFTLPPGTVLYVVPRGGASSTTQPAEPQGPPRDPVLGDQFLVFQRMSKPVQSMLIFSAPAARGAATRPAS